MEAGGRRTPDIAQPHFTECKDNEQEGKKIMQNRILESEDSRKKVDQIVRKHDLVGWKKLAEGVRICSISDY